MCAFVSTANWNEEELLYLIWEWCYWFFCSKILDRISDLSDNVLTSYVSKHSCTMILWSAGVLVFMSFSNAWKGLQAIFIFKTNKTKSLLQEHLVSSDFNYFCSMRQQEKCCFDSHTGCQSEGHQEIKDHEKTCCLLYKLWSRFFPSSQHCLIQWDLFQVHTLAANSDAHPVMLDRPIINNFTS